MKRGWVLGFASAVAAIAFTGATVSPSQAERGVSEREILLGQTMPYSGPVSPCGALGKAETAFFDMINDKGGINGCSMRSSASDDLRFPPMKIGAGYRPYFHGIVVRAGRACWLSPP